MLSVSISSCKIRNQIGDNSASIIMNTVLLLTCIAMERAYIIDKSLPYNNMTNLTDYAVENEKH